MGEREKDAERCEHRRVVDFGRPVPPGPALGRYWSQPRVCLDCGARSWRKVDDPNEESDDDG